MVSFVFSVRVVFHKFRCFDGDAIVYPWCIMLILHLGGLSSRLMINIWMMNIALVACLRMMDLEWNLTSDASYTWLFYMGTSHLVYYCIWTSLVDDHEIPLPEIIVTPLGILGSAS